MRNAKQRRSISNYVLLAVVTTLALALFAEHELRIDVCLDHGGQWDDAASHCRW